MLDAAHVKRLAEIHEEIKSVVVDGDVFVKDYDAKYLEAQPEREWAKWAGPWAFEVADASANSEKCFKAGTSCMWSSVLKAVDLSAVSAMDDTAVLDAVNTWADANADSVSQVLGGATTNAGGRIVSADALLGSYTITMDEVFIAKLGGEVDEVADEWEAGALCVLGVDVDDNDEWTDCAKDDLISFKPQFMRSWGDEFGAAIGNDVSKLGIAYMLILAYMIIMLSGWDPVNSMLGMSVVVLIIVGLSFGGCMGIGAYLGLYNNNLNNNIPFLLLGLGVDDAFVLSAEFRRACTLMPGASIQQRIGSAVRTGGMSILITSLTDALAFLIGASTVLPALSWFCSFAGIGVLLCFLLQLFLFVPCLAINARRAEANRVDCCCCFKASAPGSIERYDAPGGWCCCFCCSKSKCCRTPNKLSSFMENSMAPAITSTVGTAVTLSAFGALTLIGVIGITNIYQDFRLEWFIPADSYVQDYIAANEKYSSVGTRFSIYTPDVDYFAKQAEMKALSSYLATTPYVDRNQGVTDWHGSFMEHQAFAGDLTNGVYTDSATYYANLRSYLSGAGARFTSNVQWTSAACNCDPQSSACNPAECDAAAGVKAGRLSATLTLAATETGGDRFETMDTMRADVTEKMDGAFPYSFEFLYWEEVGVIGAELSRNLVVCGGVIVAMVCLMIPHIRVSSFVVLTIILSIVDVVGLLYFWDVTVSGVSTIYILICVGLAVDYSAHIAHIFKESTGTAKERTAKALGRIGPSVFNAVVSTFLAVMVIGTSKSFVFVVFFKAFFLVTVIAGAGGLWLLPCLLGLFGGDNIQSNAPASPKVQEAKAEQEP